MVGRETTVSNPSAAAEAIRYLCEGNEMYVHGENPCKGVMISLHHYCLFGLS